MDELQAIKRLKKGDISGLEFLITRYQVRAVRTAFLITHDEKLAEDVVQDTFLRIYQRIHHFDETQPFGPYLMRSVANAALNAAEKSSRQVVLSEDDETVVLERLIQNASTTEDLVDYALLKQEIFSVLAKLSPRERSVIVERYYLEMSEKEMADKHSIAPGTVKWLLNGARRRLRAFMKPEGES
jgi:RNA polymerase sigma-70 factor (ECF subfamily)